ncbi:hypothetical protein [Actinomadura atramentaria]|uniref:hypothetical protein n=1 Tax=Actinomadura atramentaria TaxID=1990 RepID=UPI000399D11B|nr:hypothetical protein [Actinomadura atramentaria]
MLLRHLPRDSAFARALHGEESAWGLGEHLLASVVDHLAIGNWLFTSAHTAEGESPPDPPVPVPRPGVDDGDDEGAAEGAAEPAAPVGEQDLAWFFADL